MSDREQTDQPREQSTAATSGADPGTLAALSGDPHIEIATVRSPYPDGLGSGEFVGDPIFEDPRSYLDSSDEVTVYHDPGPQTERPVYEDYPPAGRYEPEEVDDAIGGDWEDPDDWTSLPRRTSFFRRALIVGVVVSAIVIVFVTASFRWINGQLDPPGPPGDIVVIEVPVGASTNDIARILDDEGVVVSSAVFRYYLRWKDAGEFQAGVYTFRTNMAAWEAREILEGGPVPADLTFVQVIEGLRLSEIRASLLDQQPGFDAAELDAALLAARDRSTILEPGSQSVEGVLFPDTYDVTEDRANDEADLVNRMIDQFEIVAAELGLENGAEQLGLTPYELVIVASLIEEEAKVPDDRSRIARVIYNRLEAGEPLGIDATLRYGFDKAPGEPLLQSELDTEDPYNTRLVVGLPPTPIAAPSRASLEAALNPAAGDIFFYVLTNEGGVEGAHTFATTDAEFQAAVQVCIERNLGCG
ncbi:MAG: endolytic transglycosylase MltG [Acidimicrobiia bacterium]|nr:endolytic transglycosylase MltG [Acidimicrobiia bacterium]